MTNAELQGGVVFRVAESLFFLSASVACEVLPIPEIGRIPGGPPELRGVALVDGNMIPVVDVAPAGSGTALGAMLVCVAHGEKAGIVGIEIVAAGRFPSDVSVAGAVRWEGAIARPFDIGEAIAKVREGRWAV